VRGPIPPASAGGSSPGAPCSGLPWRAFAPSGNRKRGQVLEGACCTVPCRSVPLHQSPAQTAHPFSSPIVDELPLPRGESRAVEQWLGKVMQGCGNTPANSACPTKWPHFRTFPPLSILSHVFQNCPRPYMPWREINFQCNTHREIHVQNMFFWCQKKNNKRLGRRENIFPD